MSARPSVAIVVVNWNGRALLETCLEAVAGLDYARDRLELVVVDNGSTDDSRNWLATTWPRVRVLANPDNLGFAAACNQGAEAAGAEVVAFLNNDLRVDPAWLGVMVDALASDGVVAAGSRILDWEGRTVDFDGPAMNFHGHGCQRGFGRPVDGLPPAGAPEEGLFACGAAMVVRRAAFLDAGGFDPTYFAYFEDVDLGWRLWVEGGRVLYVPAAVAHHRHHASGMPDLERTRLLERNALASLFKNYDDDDLGRVLPVALALAEVRAAAADPARAAVVRAAVAEFHERRPALAAARARVQGRRRRPDAEILPLLRQPFRPSALGRAYFERQQALARAHGIVERFGGAVVDAALAGLEPFVGDVLDRVSALEAAARRTRP